MIELHFKNKRIIAISDTHGRHRELIIPETDFLIHCGDVCDEGNMEQLTDFFEWFSQQPARKKIFIAGNHDHPFDLEPEEALNLIPNNVIYLENKFTIIEEISFCSVAARPWLHESPEEKRKIDFLLTHGPCRSVLDIKKGCPLLFKFVQQQQPAYHLFGHIHERAQQSIIKGKTHFINLSMEEG